MTIQQLCDIVRAQFACKSEGSHKLHADVIEGNYQLPLMYFIFIAKSEGYSKSKIAEFLELRQGEILVSRLLNEFKEIRNSPEFTHPEGRLSRKMALIENGIRLHALGLKAELYLNQNS